MLTIDPEKLIDNESIHENCGEDLNWPLPLARPKQVSSSANAVSRQPLTPHKKKTFVVLALVVSILIIALILGLVFGFKTRSRIDGAHANEDSMCLSAISDTFLSSEKWQGVNLGNWLILERWMNPSYYAFYTGINRTDEWSFCQSLGQDCGSTLEQHWSEWITAPDIAQIASAGFNLLRVPIGFWAFIPAGIGEPYYTGSQTTQLTRILCCAQAHDMSVVVDLHGLPGSQNGLEHSGHLGPVNFFNSTNQERSSRMLTAVMDYVEASAYQEQIVAIEVANEPNVTSSQDLVIYKKYLRNALQQLTQLNDKINRNITMMFHDGFVGAAVYDSTFDPCDQVVVDYHQYFFSASPTQPAVTKAFCTFQSTSVVSRLRTFYGEWSLLSPYSGNTTWLKSFFDMQAATYANKSTGSAFWSLKVFDNAGIQRNNAWSAQALSLDGTIGPNMTWQSLAQPYC